jgi:hypothetical protein
MPSQKSERNTSGRFKMSPRAILSYAISVLLINGVVLYLMLLFSQKDFLEHVEFTPNYDIILTESRTFWGGVWFNADRLFILRNEFMIEKNPFIGETKTYHIPYGKVKNVTFEEGLDIFKINIEGTNFHVKSRYRYDTIKSSILFKSKKQFRTSEAKTFLSIFSH